MQISCRRLVALLAALLLVAAACGDSAESADPSVDADTGQSLEIHFPTPSATMDPHKASVLTVSYVYHFPIFERLTTVDVDGTILPMLATDWSFIEEGNVLELTLREDVVFHSGNPMNADAVVASIERAKQIEGSTQAGPLEIVSEADALDEFTVRLRLSRPDASVPALLSTGAGVVMDPAVFNDPEIDMNSDPSMAGSGPWVLESFEPSVSAAFVLKADDHWDPNPGWIESINLTVSADQGARNNAVQDGVANLIYVNNGQSDAIEHLVADGELAIRTIESYIQISLWFNDDRFDDSQVRQAIKQSINIDDIVNALLTGDCIPDPGVFPPSSWAASDFDDPFPFDPDEATASIESAGAEDLTFTLRTIAGTSSNHVATAIQAHLSEVGIDIEVDAIPATNAFEAFQTGDYEAFLSATVNGPDPSEVLSRSLIDGANYLGDMADQYRDRHESALDPTLDRDARAEIYTEISQAMAEDVSIIPICFTTTNWLADSSIAGLEDVPPVAFLDYTYLSFD